MKLRRRRVNLALNVIQSIVGALLLFSIIVSVVGSIGYAEALKSEYAESTYRMADTAAVLIDGDNLQKHLDEGEDEDYRRIKQQIEVYCRKIYVSLIYVIVVDQSDYGRFKCLYNTACNEVDNTDYDEWELGHERETTNEDYRKKYKAIYEGKSDYETVYRLHITDGKKQHITTLVPVKNSDGEVVGILCMQRPISVLRARIIQYLVFIAMLAAALSVLAAIIVARHNKRNFVTPIRKISEETMRFSSGEMTVNKLGDISSIEEIANLAGSIDIMEENMVKNVENLTAYTAEKERIGAELSIANTIQENSVPHTFPAFPDRNDIDIYASMTAAKEVGGDFYNFFFVDDNHLAVIMADVSGKGIPAALFMMVSNILISEGARINQSPAEVLTFVNDRICKHNEAEMFVTVWLGILDLTTGKMVAANAGHDDPAIYRKGGEFEIVKNKHGFVLGGMEGIKYSNFEIQLNEGDKLFLYTDGLPEATDKNNRMFTVDQMLRALNKNKDESPKVILEGINESVNAFVGDAPQFDDLTMLCLELKELSKQNTLCLDATNENLPCVLEFIDKLLAENDCPLKTQMKIDLAVEEIYVNIANYAYGDGIGKAEIFADCKDGEVTITFKDSGMPYNPLMKADPDTTLSAAQRQIGGLGIFLVKKNMDDVSYAYENGQNILTIKKKI